MQIISRGAELNGQTTIRRPFPLRSSHGIFILGSPGSAGRKWPRVREAWHFYPWEWVSVLASLVFLSHAYKSSLSGYYLEGTVHGNTEMSRIVVGPLQVPQ